MLDEQLPKLYNHFLTNRIRSIREDVNSNPHPAPAMAELYGLIMQQFVPPDELLEEEEENEDDEDGDDTVEGWIHTSMDTAVRFAFYLASRGIKYEDFKRCSCFTLNEQDLAKLLS